VGHREEGRDTRLERWEMNLGTVLDVGNDVHGGVAVLKEYKGQLFIWWRSSPQLVFPEQSVINGESNCL